MTSIASTGWPLAFRTETRGRVSSPSLDEIPIHVSARALEGMQKEALVDYGGWSSFRMVSDEGPYLEGTDLAPFPLAFFTAGMQFSLLSELTRLARQEGVVLPSVASVQDSFYSIAGSFLRGDALGGASSAEVRLSLAGEASRGELSRLARTAFERFPAESVMRDRLVNPFALTLNGGGIPMGGLPPSARTDVPRPEEALDRAAPVDPGLYHPGAIEKLSNAPVVHGVEGGAGSSLRAEQKRTLHIHGEGRLLQDSLMETTIHLRKPIGSSFRLVSDEISGLGGHDAAPPPLAYLAAGVAFCYLTQLGRYVRIAKRRLSAYSISQLTTLREGKLGPFDTHVFLDGELSSEEAEDLVRVGERTCFLHASMRAELPSRLLDSGME